MSREDRPTWKLIHLIAQAWPKGVLSCDVEGMTGEVVHGLLRHTVKNGAVTSVTEGRKCRYFVSPDQLQLFVRGRRPKSMDGPFYLLRTMAKREEGVCSSERVGGRSVKRTCAMLLALVAQGDLVRVPTGKSFRYFATQELADAFAAKLKKEEQNGGLHIPTTFRFTEKRKKDYEKTKQESRAEWMKKPAHIPAHVQIQYAPKPRGRYEVSGPIVGGFVSEWRALRA